MQFANEDMTAEEQVAFAWDYRRQFQKIACYNHEVTMRRLRRESCEAPENQYRNPWAELVGEVPAWRAVRAKPQT